MPCVTCVPGYRTNHIGEAEPGIPDFKEDVAGEKNVAEVEPEPGERAWDEYRTIALPDVGIGVARLAMGIAADVGVERAQHAGRVSAEETAATERHLNRRNGRISADEVD